MGFRFTISYAKGSCHFYVSTSTQTIKRAFPPRTMSPLVRTERAKRNNEGGRKEKQVEIWKRLSERKKISAPPWAITHPGRVSLFARRTNDNIVIAVNLVQFAQCLLRQPRSKLRSRYGTPSLLQDGQIRCRHSNVNEKSSFFLNTVEMDDGGL